MSADPLPPTLESCLLRIRELENRLEESEETLDAIRRGAVDAVVVSHAIADHRIYTLENADRPYRVLIEQIQEGAFTLDLDGTVFYCNRRLAEMLRTPQERVIGQPLRAFIRPDDQHSVARLLEAAREGGARDEVTLRAGDTEIPAYLSLSLLPREGEEPLLCGVLADLTQQKIHMRELSDANARLIAETAHRASVEEALRQSQKMEAVGQLTGGLAHDFNNLLAGIVGSLELLQIRLDQGRTADLARYINAAMSSASRAASLTHRLLAFSRRQTLDPKLIEPNALVAGMEELLERTVGPAVTVQTVLPAGVGPILCDPNQLESALLNLAINARDAMPAGGSLRIETADFQVDEPFASRHDIPLGAYVTVAVTDTGIGMSAEVAARAFDPFFTTKPIGQGTGLGLSMIYGFARQSGGQVVIRSREGAGTTVTIYLPRHRGEVGTQASHAKAAVPGAEAGETVLVVEDEPIVRLLITEVLQDLGYTAIEAADGPAGLREVERHPDIDLLVTDVGLPGGMNGRQLADAARVRRPDLKILFITGYAEAAALGGHPPGQGMEVMTKPFAIDALASRIKQVLSRGSAPGPRSGPSPENRNV